MKQIPIIKLDMSLPPDERLEHIPYKVLKAGATLARRTNDQIPDTRLRALAGVLLSGASAFRNPYIPEINAWSRRIGISRAEAIISNLTYELSEAAIWGEDVYTRFQPQLEWIRDTAVGAYDYVRTNLTSVKEAGLACTAGVACYPKIGNVLVRSMDWCLEGLGRHTVIWNCVNAEAGTYYSVGWPGYVGVLSGNAPGRFAATINQAFPTSAPTLQWPPSHLLRWVFDNCENYEDALKTLKASKVCFPAFVTIAGIKLGEAAIVELHPEGSRIHRTEAKKPIAIGNDYLSGDWRGEDEDTLMPFDKGPVCEHRRNKMLTELRRRRPRDLKSAIKATQADWIWNEGTVQQMAFSPNTGGSVVIGLEDTAPVCFCAA